jgi:hypothetical protein
MKVVLIPYIRDPYPRDLRPKPSPTSGFREVRALARPRKVLWKDKLYTSLALIRGTPPQPARSI